MTNGGAHPRRSRVYLASLPLVGWAVLAAVGYYPTALRGGRAALTAMVAAQAVVVVIVYVTLLLAMGGMVGVGPPERLKLAFKAATVRFVLTLAVVGAVAWRGPLSAPAFLVWAAISYVVMIKVETIALIGWIRILERRACA